MRTRALFLVLPTLALPLSAQSRVNGPHGDHGAHARHVDLTPIALETAPGLHDIYLVAHPDGASTLVLEDVALIDAELVGYAPKDRLRLDRPTPAGGGNVARSIRVPGGGALHLLRRQGHTEVLFLRGDSGAQVLLSVLESSSLASLVSELHVAPDGQCALVATRSADGGDVYILDLTGQAAPACLTSSLPPLDVDGESLRASSQGTWFVADGDLYRAPAGADAAAVELGLLPGEEILDELVLAADGGHAAVVLELEDDQRRLLVVPIVGAPQLVTAQPGPFARAEYEEAFAPFIALAADGSRIAYRTTDDAQELFVTELATPGAPLHITSEPDFPVYIDNVGVLGFAQPDQLCFFAGDLVISGVDADELLGASDMYVATFDGQGGASYYNVTQTNGQAWPPFTEPARLSISDVLIDPLVERFLLVGEDEEEVQDLSCFRIDGQGYHGSAVQVLLTGMDEDPTIFGCEEHVLVVKEPEEDEVDEEQDLLTELHVLQPAVIGLQVFTHLADHAEGSEVASVASRAGHAAYVVTASSGARTAHLVELAAETSASLMAPGWTGAIADVLAVSDGGQVVLGWAPQVGPLNWTRVLDPLITRPLDLPPLAGYALAH